MLRSPVVVEASVRPMLIRLLVERVLDLKDLAGDVHLAHVNCEGEHFFVLHKHFERMYAALVEHADLLGERVRQLGGTMLGGSRTVATGSTLIAPDETQHDGLMLARGICDRTCALLVQLGNVRRACTGEIEPGTYELLVGVMLDLEKRCWMLMAFLGEPAVALEQREAALGMAPTPPPPAWR